jgi:hypothetical protein
MNKVIVVQWVPEQANGYNWAMRVITSTHPIVAVGSRFDFGFFGLATEEGYTILSLPAVEDF